MSHLFLGVNCALFSRLGLRFELSSAPRKKGGYDIYRLKRVLFPRALTSQAMAVLKVSAAGMARIITQYGFASLKVPLPESRVEPVYSSLDWSELRWHSAGVTVRDRIFPIRCIRFCYNHPPCPVPPAPYLTDLEPATILLKDSQNTKDSAESLEELAMKGDIWRPVPIGRKRPPRKARVQKRRRLNEEERQSFIAAIGNAGPKEESN